MQMAEGPVSEYLYEWMGCPDLREQMDNDDTSVALRKWCRPL